ncbi:MAG: VOC family protein [Alphaproteobacteria bacterium]|nr:VOC family protein [Alphaproteobacteria bacterium]
MTVTLDHTIVHARDAGTTARFMTEILGLPAPRTLGPFTVVRVGATSLDLMETDQPIAPRHFAFLVGEAEFDAIFGRILARRLPHWADPYKHEPGRINRWDDGRGVYFADPNGHLLEILTRPYGSGGAQADNPNPLLGR